MPNSGLINDYELFNDPLWYNKNIDNIEEKEDDSKIIQKSKFIL